MKYTNKIITILLALASANVAAQENFSLSGSLVSKNDNAPVVGGYVLLIQDGKAVNAATSDKAGKFHIGKLTEGSYLVEVTCLGYKAVQDSIDLKGNVQKQYEMAEETVMLDEVAVEGDRSLVVERMANGERFFLSPKAKKEKNPFIALQEVPSLITDVNNSSVKLLDGSAPLILIDGNLVNTGISPISPSDIESVEVINNVSARYLQDGVNSILNIKLKRSGRQYVWLEGATRHDIPLNKGLGVGYFEVGNSKVSLYGRAAYNYTYHDDMESTVRRSNTTYSQNYEQASRNDGHNWLGELILKFRGTDKDYFAVHAYGTTQTGDTKQDGEGNYNAENYRFDQSTHEKSDIFTSSLYYKHDFAQFESLETTLAYNYNRNDYNSLRTESYADVPYDQEAIYKNKRNSASLSIDYTNYLDNGQTIMGGFRSSLQWNEIDNRMGFNPLFKHHHFNQYIYGGWGINKNKIAFAFSAAVEGIWTKAGDEDSRYFRPRGSASLTYRINKHNSLQLSYRLSNTAPSVSNLNPYNISTDSLVVEVGNPDLKPQMTNSASLRYTLNVGKLYIQPSASYRYVSDMIESYGYTENGIYYNTYENLGHFSHASAGLRLSYNFPWGGIYGGGGWNADYFTGRSGKHSAYASFGYNARVKKVSFYGSFDYGSRSYSAISYTQYNRPEVAQMQVNYNFTPDFYISFCLEHVTGKYTTKTVTNDGSFRSVVENRFTEKNLHPWILVRYTFRKNTSKKIKLENVIYSKEEGISIKRSK